MEGASLPLRPQQRTQFTADGLVRLKLDDLTKEELQKELEIAESCCNYFPYFNTWTNLGIAQCRLEQYKAAESSLREAKRQEALQYGYNDLLPTIEAYLAISLHKQGKLKEANQFKDSFVEKIADVNVEPWIQTMIKKLDEIPSGQSTN